MASVHEPRQVRWFSIVAAPGTVIFMVRGDVTLEQLDDELRDRGFKHIHSSQEIVHLMSINEWASFKSTNRIIRPKEAASEVPHPV